jgi:two-component system chemotaxis response regulator CheY
LIVDDSMLTRQLLKSIVALRGHEVVGTADNGRDGLEQAVALRPDVLLLDMLMPMMNGIEVAQSLRSAAPEIKVILISSVSATDKIKAARDGGVAYYILKPFEPQKVLEVIDRCLAAAQPA